MRLHAKYPASVWAAAGLCSGDTAIEGEADLRRERTRHRGGRHAPSGPHEKTLTEPAFQRGDLPAHGSVGQPEFDPSLGIAGGTGRDLEDT